jgi:hypothetical protein
MFPILQTDPVTGKFVSVLTEHRTMKSYRRSRGIAPRIRFTSAVDGGEWSAPRPGRFTLKERAAGTHRIGGWVGTKAGLDAVARRKNSIIAAAGN